MKILQTSLCLGLLGSLLGCTGGGSGGTEIGNAFTISLYLPNGEPASNAQARLRSSTFVASASENQSNNYQTDSSGSLTFKELPAGNWNLEVRKDSQSLLLAFKSTSDTTIDLGMDTLREQTTLFGESPSTPPGTRIVILGTEHSTLTDADGKFAFDSLPFGDLILQAIVTQDTLRSYASLDPGDTSEADPLASEVKSLLVEDFTSDHSTHHHRFASFVGGGWWSLSFKAGMLVTREDSTSAIPIEFDSIRQSRAVHFSVTIPGTVTDPWLRCLMQIGQAQKGYDLREVDSLVFYAKGSGTTEITLHLLDSVQALTNPTYDLVLPGTWTRISIPMDSITKPNIVDPKAWRLRVMDVSWGFISDGELWLDDVQFVGATRQQIWGE